MSLRGPAAVAKAQAARHRLPLQCPEAACRWPCQANFVPPRHCWPGGDNFAEKLKKKEKVVVKKHFPFFFPARVFARRLNVRLLG